MFYSFNFLKLNTILKVEDNKYSFFLLQPSFVWPYSTYNSVLWIHFILNWRRTLQVWWRTIYPVKYLSNFLLHPHHSPHSPHDTFNTSQMAPGRICHPPCPSTSLRRSRRCYQRILNSGDNVTINIITLQYKYFRFQSLTSDWGLELFTGAQLYRRCC